FPDKFTLGSFSRIFSSFGVSIFSLSELLLGDMSQFSPTTIFVGPDTLPSLSFSTAIMISPLFRLTPLGTSTFQLPFSSIVPSDVLPFGNVTTIVLPGVPFEPVISVSLSSTGLTVGAGSWIISSTDTLDGTVSEEPSGYVTVT